MKKSTRYILSSLFFFTALFSVVETVDAASISVNPVVIDKKAHTRDIIKETLTLTNTGSRKVHVYAFVNNINVQTGEVEFLDPSHADMSVSLANWISISRAVLELSPGEEKSIDFEITVNLRALPGVYHASIAFGEGSTRDDAVKKFASASSVAVNIEVLDDAKERLQLKRFVPDKNFFSGFPVSFSYEIENIGNRDLTPSGEIRVYNRRGEEIAVVETNAQGEKIAPDVTAQLASVLDGAKGFGRFKALLDMEYGSKDQGTIQDTVFFWVIPWIPLVVIFSLLIIGAVILGILIHRRFERHTTVTSNQQADMRNHIINTRKPKS